MKTKKPKKYAKQLQAGDQFTFPCTAVLWCSTIEGLMETTWLCNYIQKRPNKAYYALSITDLEKDEKHVIWLDRPIKIKHLNHREKIDQSLFENHKPIFLGLY